MGGKGDGASRAGEGKNEYTTSSFGGMPLASEEAGYLLGGNLGGIDPPPRAGHDIGRVNRTEKRVKMRRPGNEQLQLASLQKTSDQSALQWEQNVETSSGLIDDVNSRQGDHPSDPQTGSVSYVAIFTVLQR